MHSNSEKLTIFMRILVIQKNLGRQNYSIFHWQSEVLGDSTTLSLTTLI
jgi:hypothetical protein